MPQTLKLDSGIGRMEKSQILVLEAGNVKKTTQFKRYPTKCLHWHSEVILQPGQPIKGRGRQNFLRQLILSCFSKIIFYLSRKQLIH